MQDQGEHFILVRNLAARSSRIKADYTIVHDKSHGTYYTL